MKNHIFYKKTLLQKKVCILCICIVEGGLLTTGFFTEVLYFKASYIFAISPCLLVPAKVYGVTEWLTGCWLAATGLLVSVKPLLRSLLLRWVIIQIILAIRRAVFYPLAGG